MAGWLFCYDFSVSGQKLALTQWHEFEFDRAEEHYQLEDGTPIGEGKSHGINGAFSLWWTLTKQITAGVQYCYSYYKLGYAGYANAVIYSLKYNF